MDGERNSSAQVEIDARVDPGSIDSNRSISALAAPVNCPCATSATRRWPSDPHADAGVGIPATKPSAIAMARTPLATTRPRRRPCFHSARQNTVSYTHLGLEGQLPDAQVKQLLETHVLPAFAQGRYEDGLEAWVKAVYEALGGDKAGVQQVHARAGKGKAGWADLWDQAWKEGARLLPAVWREYLQGAVWERFVILLFASIPTGFALIGITVFGLTVQRLVQLPGKLRARHE